MSGSQFDFIWLSAGVPHGGASYVWCPTASRNQGKIPHRKSLPLFLLALARLSSDADPVAVAPPPRCLVPCKFTAQPASTGWCGRFHQSRARVELRGQITSSPKLGSTGWCGRFHQPRARVELRGQITSSPKLGSAGVRSQVRMHDRRGPLPASTNGATAQEKGWVGVY